MNRLSLTTLRMALGVLILCIALRGRAQSGSDLRQMENRFLFIIDTSSSMKSRTNGIDQAVAGLLANNMRGEFRKGDTIGVWTYDEEIHADFPMQTWAPERKDEISRDVMRYLRHVRYEKRARLEKVLSAAGKVMAASDRLTVIFIYDGTDLIHGTLFDADINELQKKYAHQFKSAHAPMVTVMAERNGQVFDYSINYPNAVTIPHTAIEIPPPPEPVVVVPVVPPAPHRHLEIVMSGTNRVDSTASAPDSASNALPTPPANIVMSGRPQPASQPSAEATNAAVAPADVATSQVSSANPPASETKSESGASQPSPLVAVQPSPVPAPASPPVLAQTAPASNQPSAPSAAPTPAADIKTVAQSVRDQQPPPAATMPDSHASAPEPAAAIAPAPSSITVASPAGQQIALFVIAFSLLAIAVSLVVFLVRRSRTDSPSLITQSMDRGH